ncbi:hypothetical protein [Sphingomonas sp. Leaf257]|uniref:hypothetical protein n=1 Tax=Sphingomonas sp. Leaf257 TaxID=1736309 RepID=UPI0006FCB120|nr:hypothetical protein [Sphingomonas sp. Leaf257]KQO49791.1 hypothetical protein ASF14_13185 [Sphingomonas sp. Leaf257]
MPNMQIDLAALASFVDTTLDYNADYEEDCFCFSFGGQRVYCERHRNFFKLEVAGKAYQLPR